jgi:hypothetical protein
MTLLAVAGLATVMTSVTAYFGTITLEKVPTSVTPMALLQVLGIGLAAVALVLEPTWVTGLLGLMTTALGGFVLYLLPLRKLPDGHLTEVVGQPVSPLVVLDHSGKQYDLSALKGRVLLKFFRGSW